MHVTVAVQKGIARSRGMALSILAGFGLCWWARGAVSNIGVLLLATIVLLSVAVKLVRRLRQLTPREARLVDLELFTQLSVLLFAGILHTSDGLAGAYYPLVYALMMVVAGFARPVAAVGTGLFVIILETSLTLCDSGTSQGVLVVHAALVALFMSLNLVIFRAEIARVRRLSKAKVEAELQKMKEAARSFRLMSAPSHTTSGDSSTVAPNAEERLVQSGIEEIHEALNFATNLLRRTLKLRTALLLWLSPNGESLQIRELSTDEDSILPGPFSVKDGIFGAALAQKRSVSIHGPRSVRHAPYYAEPPNIGSVCAVPLMDHGHVRGLLIVDREEESPFSAEAEELLATATRYMLRAVENERVFVQLERAKLEQGKLYRAANALAASTTEAQVVEAGVNSAREFAAFDFAVVTLFDRSSNEHEICAVSGKGAADLVGKRFKHNSGLVSMVVANRHPLPYRGDYDPARQVVFSRRLAPPPMPALLVLPLLVHDRPLGTLVLGSKRRGTFGDSVRPILEVLASHMSVSLANARMVKRLEELATTDGLTGLLNKRALLEQAEQKIRAATRFDTPLSVLVCDIDHFKRVNDTYGHDVGDQVIKGFADVLRRVKRDIDVVGRFGGEEFVLVCEQTDGDGARLLGERIRTELQAEQFKSELGMLQVACSVGVATFPAAGKGWEQLFKATDDALYVSKRGGRNRVTVWTPRLQGAAA